MTGAEQQYDPWPSVAAAWSATEPLYEYAVNIKNGEVVRHAYKMLLPLQLGEITPFPLYLDADTTLTACFEGTGKETKLTEALQSYRQATEVLLSSMFIQRMRPGRNDFPLLFVPADILDLNDWISKMRGSYSALNLKQDGTTLGMVRNQGEYGSRYRLKDHHARSARMLNCVKLENRTDVSPLSIYSDSLSQTYGHVSHYATYSSGTCLVTRTNQFSTFCKSFIANDCFSICIPCHLARKRLRLSMSNWIRSSAPSTDSLFNTRNSSVLCPASCIALR